jgi:hypothetical protein
MKPEGSSPCLQEPGRNEEGEKLSEKKRKGNKHE